MRSGLGNGCVRSTALSMSSCLKVSNPLPAVACYLFNMICCGLECGMLIFLIVNNVTGSNLIECDQTVLKEMGIKKIGDRVRIFVAIKQLRTRAVGNHKKRTRDSIAALDIRPLNTPYTPSVGGSPRQIKPTRYSDNRRRSHLFPTSAMNNPSQRPSSPLPELDSRPIPISRNGGASPVGGVRKDSQPHYNTNPTSANTVSGVHPGTPSRHNQGMDTTIGKLQAGSPHIRVIYNSSGNPVTKVLDIKNCNSADQIMLNVLRKLNLNEHHFKNYCFYTLNGLDPDPANCYRLSDADLVRVCRDTNRSDRGRLILRKIHAGEPDEEDLRKAASIAIEEFQESHAKDHVNAVAVNNESSRIKLEKMTGVPWDSLQNPLSPAIFGGDGFPASEGQRYGNSTWDPPKRSDSFRAPKPRIKEFLGGRPPSELISQELTTYFPDHQKETIENTVRMSMRRSARLSKAQSRISVASNLSYNSSLKDAPPLPAISDTWLSDAAKSRGPRPLSVSRFALPQAAYRDSIISTSLQPLQEESPLEPNRKSYVSFDSDSQSTNNNAPDNEGQSVLQSYFDESGSSGPNTEAGSTYHNRLSHIIAEDEEESDEELDSFLKGDAWDNVKWMQGALIGQGSFGSVFLALHAVTGELMAVKQVEVPSNTNSNLDKRKESMVAALKREIDLLRDLQHENIVQYLGSNSDDEHFNIFLEYVPGGSVAAMLNSYGQLQEPLIRNFVRQILAGLSYLHGRDIIHRDIKGANVLVDNKGNIKISDFGISKRVEASALLQPAKNGGHIHRPSLQGSVFWMAPEVVKQTSYTRKADIWSLGCLIVEMFTGTHPFPNCSQLQAIFQIGNSSAKPTTPENASDEGQAFLKQTFEIDHEKRPSADELLLSPFLKQIA